MTWQEILARDEQAWPYRQQPSDVEGFTAILDRRALLAEVRRLHTKIDAVRLVIADTYEHGQVDGADLMAALDVEP